MKVAAFSPHLDDAVFSAGSRLADHAARGDEVEIHTVFTGNVDRPQGFALACQLDKGLGPEVDYMALRRAEDVAACAHIGAEAVHWPLLEAPHRGYHNAAALFGPRLPGDTVFEEVLKRVEGVLNSFQPDCIYAPYGVGAHVDHLVVREAVECACNDAILWEDYPYAMRETSPPRGVEREAGSPALAERKLAAVLAYDSQLGFQFGSREEAARQLGAWGQEGFTRPMPRPLPG